MIGYYGVFTVAPKIVLLVMARLSLELRFPSRCANKILNSLFYLSFTRQDDFSSLAVGVHNALAA